VSDIRQVDAAFHVKRAVPERSPARDFSRELAETGNGKIANHSNAHLHDKLATDLPVRALMISSKPPVDVLHASSWASAVATSDVATQEQLGVAVQPTGITEALLGSRVFGVHLLASTYLSELTAQGESGTGTLPGVTSSTMANTSPQLQSAVSEVPLDFSETSHNASLHEEVAVALGVLVKSEATEATSHSQPVSGASIALEGASTMLWPESLLRLTRERDGSAVIWVRDYRMSDEGASQVVDALVKGAETAGIRLGRIILNGREVWISPKNY
jgi:hypothetical protein